MSALFYSLIDSDTGPFGLFKARPGLVVDPAMPSAFNVSPLVPNVELSIAFEPTIGVPAHSSRYSNLEASPSIGNLRWPSMKTGCSSNRSREKSISSLAVPNPAKP